MTIFQVSHHGTTALPSGWRGPHDPPGSNFRAQQTFEFYGYWPALLIEPVECERTAIEPEFLPAPATAALVEDFDPMLALIEARLLVEKSVGVLGQWSAGELLPYVDELQGSTVLLLASLSESEAFAEMLRENGL